MNRRTIKKGKRQRQNKTTKKIKIGAGLRNLSRYNPGVGSYKKFFEKKLGNTRNTIKKRYNGIKKALGHGEGKYDSLQNIQTNNSKFTIIKIAQ